MTTSIQPKIECLINRKSKIDPESLSQEIIVVFEEDSSRYELVESHLKTRGHNWDRKISETMSNCNQFEMSRLHGVLQRYASVMTNEIIDKIYNRIHKKKNLNTKYLNQQLECFYEICHILNTMFENNYSTNSSNYFDHQRISKHEPMFYIKKRQYLESATNKKS